MDQDVYYVLKVKLKTGKEITIYKDTRSDVGEYLKRRILKFSPKDRKVERIKPPKIKDTGSKIIITYLRVEGIFISWFFFVFGILFLFWGIYEFFMEFLIYQCGELLVVLL